MRHVLLKVPSSDLVTDGPASGSQGTLRGRIAADAHPGDPRIEALWRVSPWMAALSVACALVVLWGLKGTVPLAALSAWAALIVVANIVIVRARRRAAGYGHAEWLRSPYWTVFEAAIHA